jgi:hypothetical protein
MNFWIEWVLATQRAAWFPLIWLLGLEAKAVEFPEDMLPRPGGLDRDQLRIIGPGSAGRRAAASW